MRNPRFSPIDRRGFLRFGAAAAVLFAAGCENGGGEPTQITTPPVETGNRKRLDKFTEKGAAAAEKASKKKK